MGGSGFWAEVLAQWTLEFRFDAFVFRPAEDPESVRVSDGADSFFIRDGLVVAQTIHYTVEPLR